MSAKPATRRKALKNTGSTTAQDGVRSEGQQKMGTGSQNFEERAEVAKRYRRAPFTVKPMEHGSLQDGKVGVGEAQKLEHTSRRFQRSRCHGRLLESGECVAGQWCK